MSKETKCTCERPDDNTCDYCEQQSSIQILEEAADNWVRQPIIGTKRESFIAGYKLAQEKMYSEEEVINAFNEGQALNVRGKLIQGKEWFEQFKKK
jgi:hypothetical protein